MGGTAIRGSRVGLAAHTPALAQMTLPVLLALKLRPPSRPPHGDRISRVQVSSLAPARQLSPVGQQRLEKGATERRVRIALEIVARDPCGQQREHAQRIEQGVTEVSSATTRTTADARSRAPTRSRLQASTRRSPRRRAAPSIAGRERQRQLARRVEPSEAARRGLDRPQHLEPGHRPRPARRCRRIPSAARTARRCRPSPAARRRSARPGRCRSRRRPEPPSGARPSAPCRQPRPTRHTTPAMAAALAGSRGDRQRAGRSTRRNRIPEPSAAGRSVTATLAPLWRPTPAQPIV